MTSTEYSCFFNLGIAVALISFIYLLYSLLSSSIGLPSASSTFFFNLLICFFNCVNLGTISNEKSTISIDFKRKAKLFSCSSISESLCCTSLLSLREVLEIVFEALSCFKPVKSRPEDLLFLIVLILMILQNKIYLKPLF